MRVSEADLASMLARNRPGKSPGKSHDTEAKWQSEVRELAHLYGWHLQYHTARSDRSDPGYPDLTLVNVRQGRVLFAELKRPGGKLTVEQQLWIDSLRRCGCEAFAWWPKDRDEVLRVLSGKDGER